MSSLFNPIQNFFTWFSQVYELMPLAIRMLVNLSLSIVLVLALFGIFFKVKH